MHLLPRNSWTTFPGNASAFLHEQASSKLVTLLTSQPEILAGQPPAVVVGLCAHGLAIVKALAQNNVVVHALETNPSLPGTATRYAQVHYTDDINGPGLVRALRELHQQLAGNETPVLFLTNDNMVREVAAGRASLEGLYRLSWAGCGDTIRHFIEKSAIESHCLANGLRYPMSFTLRAESEIVQFPKTFSFPVIVKPIRPLSGFKVKLIESAEALRELVSQHHADLPFLVQQHIPGNDERLRFCALYLDSGKILARFDGQKLRSRRPALGGTTVAVSSPCPPVFEETVRFFRGLNLSGPVSLEVKLDDEASAWVIEPTVGRTDYWVGCCTANGVNLPYTEYCHQAGLPLPNMQQESVAVWCDTEHDTFACLAILKHPRWSPLRGFRVVFPYLDRRDMRPFLRAVSASVLSILVRLAGRVTRLFRQSNRHRT
jgi:predicted ATP-grasp superfamily ATP-dependent carboligase